MICCNCKREATTFYFGDPCCESCFEILRMHSVVKPLSSNSITNHCSLGDVCMHKSDCLFNECGEGDCMIEDTPKERTKRMMTIEERIKQLDKKIDEVQEWLIRNYR